MTDTPHVPSGSIHDRKLNHVQTWTGSFKGIAFEVMLSETLARKDRQLWTFYLHFPAEQYQDDYHAAFELPVKFDEKGRIHYSYTSSELNRLAWAGGMTFYKRHFGTSGETVSVHAGCDYSHSWDQDHSYNLHYILGDVRVLIWDLWATFPRLKIRSPWSGEWCYRDEGKFNERGDFWSDKDAAARVSA